MPVSSVELDERTRGGLSGAYCELSDGVTHYRLSGPADGPAVVMVHGGTVPHWIWDSLAECLSDDGFRALCYDQFGRGFSDRPKTTYNRALYERQLRELVDRLAFHEPFDVFSLRTRDEVHIGNGNTVFHGCVENSCPIQMNLKIV